MREVLAYAALAAIVAAGPGATPAAAQDFPSRPVTIIAGTTAGSSTDLIVRFLADKLEVELGQPVLVHNQPGAAGAVATQSVQKAAADGYTLVSAVSGFFIAASQLQPDLNFDPRRDLTGVARAADQYLVILTRTDSPFGSILDVIDASRNDPGSVTYATTGVGGTAHLHMELFSLLNDVQLTHVPYAGSSYRPDLYAGRVDLASSGSGNLISNRDQLRGLLTGAMKRSDLIPDVPVSGDMGLPEYEIPSWVGFFGPAGLPEDVIAKYDAAFGKIMGDPANIQAIKDLGFDPHYEPHAAFTQSIVRDYQTLSDVIERAGLKPKS